METNQALAIQQTVSPVSVLANTDQARAMAEVQASLVIAQRNPRNELKARDRLLQACQRPGLAEAAVYTFPRGGQKVSGPSIRLAEVAARCFGNMVYGFRELSRRDGESECESFAWDLETNTKAVRQFAVRHLRDKKGGPVPLSDERDIYELIANQAQRRVRACILEIVPGDIIEDAVAECERSQHASLGAKDRPLKDIIKDMLASFGKMGVSREAMEKRLGHRVDASTVAEIVGLKKVYASIRDGFSEAKDWFDVDAGKAADINEKVMNGNQANPKPTDPAPAPTPGSSEDDEPPAYAATEDRPTVLCHNRLDDQEKPKRVSVTECESCPTRDGCPTWI